MTSVREQLRGPCTVCGGNGRAGGGDPHDDEACAACSGTGEDFTMPPSSPAREQIEADIRTFEEGLAWSEGSPGRGALRRAIERLRNELSRLDGPAPGFVRVRIGVSVTSASAWAAVGGTGPEAHGRKLQKQTEHGPGDAWSWVVADVPLPQVVEVQGVVEGAS